MLTKQALLESGRRLVKAFCELNRIRIPHIFVVPHGKWDVSQCAYYRDQEITICIEECAHVGRSFRAWSWPGYTVDRTPYGVLQHELGHHCDFERGELKGLYWSEYSPTVRERSQEKPMTTYCPNNAEWFAEMFRVFVTNPDLLRLYRPKTYEILIKDGFKPIFKDDWRTRLKGAPQRTINAAARKCGEEVPKEK